MKLLYSFLLVLVSIYAIGQSLSLDPGTLKYNLAADEEYKQSFTLTNNTNTSVDWYWTIELSEDSPASWTAFVCDLVTCWSAEKDTFPIEEGAVNTLGPGESTPRGVASVTVRANGEAGVGSARLCVYDDPNFTASKRPP